MNLLDLTKAVPTEDDAGFSRTTALRLTDLIPRFAETIRSDGPRMPLVGQSD